MNDRSVEQWEPSTSPAKKCAPRLLLKQEYDDELELAN
jgi:hypothetical protein